MQDLSFTLSSLHEAYEQGRSPLEVIEEVYRRIEAINDPGIFIYQFDKSEVLAAASALGKFDPEKPLWGIPFAIKDNIDAEGKPTTAACPDYAYTAKEDAFIVRQLRHAGALLIGKTNLDQFATGLVGVRSPYAPPKNAIDPEIVPGGSSAGSAVAVSHGIISFSLGTDTAGSGRVPAALNNIVGLKPSLGSFSATGCVPACRTLDTISVFALTVDDAYKVYQSACVYDVADAYSKKIKAQPISEIPPALKIGIPDANSIKFFGDTYQQKSFESTLVRLKNLGVEIIEVDFQPFYDVADMLYEGAWVAERYSVIEDLLRDNPDAVFPVTRKIISAAENFSSADVFRGIYKLEDLKRKAEPVLEAVDMFCVPTIPTFYSVDDLSDDPVQPNSNFGTYTNFVNLMDMSALAVPIGSREDNRPGSVTLIGASGEDGLLASLARKLENVEGRTLGATDWTVPALRPAPEMAQADEMYIAVCGAHMSGLPLNSQLTQRGARFVRKATTAPSYKFYALAGGPPERPGLVYCGPEKNGASIKLEIWSLPLENVGSFLKDIPAPLGIGSVFLSDGSSVKGFICEAEAINDAKDITSFGGWRKYLS
jgi:allophanate hydrolase